MNRIKIIDIMGTSNKIQEMRSKRIAYQEIKKQEVINRVASYLSEDERKIFLSGDGFIVLPEQERVRLRIDSYPYLR